MSVLQRTVKIVFSAVSAIFLAQALGLSNAASAGIVAILSVLETRRSSLRMARQRLLSALLALSIAALTFYLTGFSLLSLALYLVFYVPLAYSWHLEAGIAPSTVLVTHLLLERDISPAFLGNELALFILGAGVALTVNSYMPSKQAAIDHYHQLIEEELKGILMRFNSFLLEGDGRNEGKMIESLDRHLEEALALVYLDRYNQVFNQTNYQVHYFEMRQQQNNILRQMAQNINQCHLESQESLILAQLFEQTARELSEDNPAQGLLDEIARFYETFRQRDLPKTRQEFETRARLFQLLHDMETFIRLKVDFYQHYDQD